MPSPRREPRPDNSSMILRSIEAGLSTTMQQCSCVRLVQGQSITDIHEVCFRNEEQSDCSVDGEARLLIKDLNRRFVRLEEQQVLLDKLDDKHRLAELEERLTVLESKSRSATVVAHHPNAGTPWEGGRRLAALEALDVGTRLATIEAAITAGPLHQSFRQCRVLMTEVNKDPCGAFEDPPTLSDAITEHVAQYVATFWKATSSAFRKDLAKLMADIRQVREHDMELQQRAGDQLSKQLREASGSLERRLEMLEQHTVKGSSAGCMVLAANPGMMPTIEPPKTQLDSKKVDLKQPKDRKGPNTSRSLFVVEPAEKGGGPAAPVLPRFLSGNGLGMRHPGLAARCDSRRSTNGAEAMPARSLFALSS